MRERVRAFCRKRRTLIAYVIAGGLTTGVNYAVYVALTRLCGVAATPANTAAVAAAIVFAYWVNKRYVFRSHRQSRRALWAEAGSFVLARLGGMALEIGGVYLLVDVWGVWDILAKVVVSVFVVAVNYVVSRLVVFRGAE